MESGGSAEPSSSSTSQSGPSSASLESTSTAPTLPTQDIVDGGLLSDEEEDAPTSWGRLFPLGAGFELTELQEDKNTYIFGRGTDNDVRYAARNFPKNKGYQSISTKHFKIVRETTSDGKPSHVFLTDLSSNGTFINGEKIGKNKTQVLKNDDEISLPLRKSKAYVFQDCAQIGQQSESYPEEITDKFIISRTLGRGACGEVKLVFRKGSHCEKFAMKIISKKKFSVATKQSGSKDEVKILKELNHPCIIAIEDVIETDNALYIVLELAGGGELFERVVSMKRFPDKTAKLFFYQMLCAVQYLHEKGITHRDLKPENVLLSSDETETLIKITDFGMSKIITEQSLMKTLCGTLSYLAPEVLLSAGIGGYSKAVDCWSLGVILFICLGGYPPFSDEIKTHTLNEQVINGIYDFPKEFWQTVPADAIDLIKKLLTVDPKKRLSVADALEHPWMKDEEVIEKARTLMFGPAAVGGMLPPITPVKRKFPTDDESNERDKRLATDNEV